MRTIIAGSRVGPFKQDLDRAIRNCGWKVTTVISGGAKGADQLGEEWALKNGIPLEVCAANWLEDGRAAGMIRNARMADIAEALIALWDGSSRGTAHMIKTAKRNGLRVHIELTI